MQYLNNFKMFYLLSIVFYLIINSASAQDVHNVSDVLMIPKCCPLQYTLAQDESTGCAPTNLTFIPEYWGIKNTTEDTEINVIVGDPCPRGKYRLEPEKEDVDEFHIQRNGSLWIPNQYGALLNISDYCVEVFETINGPTVLPLVCFPNQPVDDDNWKKITMIVYPTGLLLSVPFLLVTLVIYAAIPELRDTQGKTLCCHISCLIVAYITLAMVQLEVASLSENSCVFLGFLIQFSFLACFFWLNVLCYDTWWRITSPLTYCSYKAEMKKFLWYSIYAWSLPTVLLGYTLLMELSPIIPPSYLKPNIGYSCWFNDDRTVLLYFYGPIGFILITNVVLFILSARHIPEYTEYAERTETSLQVNEVTARKRAVEMFKKCAQLFAVMGINWIMEILSWALGGPSLVWFVTDIINTLQGIIIFIIFVIQIPRVKRLAMQYYRSFL